MDPLMTELRGKTVTLRCTHETIWPPIHVKLPEDLETQRANGLLDDHKYEQIKTWERVCGLLDMSAEKCPLCPLVKVEDKKGMRPLAEHEKPLQPPFYARSRKGKRA